MLLALNFTCGLVAVVLMTLVLRGQWGHLVARHKDGTLKSFADMTAGDLMRLGITVYHIKALIRIGFYDVYRPLENWERTDVVAIANASFSAFAILGSLAVLAAFYRNIPEDERHGYTWLSSPWHPSPPPFRSLF